MSPMTGSLPQLGVENVRSDDFLETSLSIFLPDELHQSVVNVSAFRLEKTGTRRQFVEEEQFLLLKQKLKIVNPK